MGLLTSPIPVCRMGLQDGTIFDNSGAYPNTLAENEESYVKLIRSHPSLGATVGVMTRLAA